MPQQPNLFSSNTTRESAEEPSGSSSKSPRRKNPLWLRRTDLFVRVAVRIYLGLLVLVLPWTQIWNDNHLLTVVPHLSGFALSGIVRGIVSGLGILNIWIAVADAIHYEQR